MADRTSGGNYVNHDIRSNNGKYIVMPPYKAGQDGWGNLKIPNVCLDGGDIAMQYPVNTKFVDFDRTHIYGYCYSRGEATVKANIGLMNQSVKETVTWGATAGVAGDTLVSIDGTTLDDETTADANIFAGGYLMPRTNPYSDYRIISNTSYIGGSVSATEMDIVIENGLTAAVVAAVASCYLDRNPFAKMRHQWGATAECRRSVVGVTLIDPTASTYQWVQTWGPIHMPSDEQMGSADWLQSAYFNSDGSIQAGSSVDLSSTRQDQYAGYAIGSTTSAMTWFLCLQLER